MSRLIDADNFKDFLQSLTDAGAPYEGVISLLDNQPTAYDVEKVVEQLEELRDFQAEKFNISKYGLMQLVIDVVRAGGKGVRCNNAENE